MGEQKSGRAFDPENFLKIAHWDPNSQPAMSAYLVPTKSRVHECSSVSPLFTSLLSEGELSFECGPREEPVVVYLSGMRSGLSNDRARAAGESDLPTPITRWTDFILSVPFLC
jgi:hypothetical protein